MSGQASNVTGSIADMLRRMRAVLPSGWFPAPDNQNGSSTPVLDGLLSGFGYAWQAVYALVTYVRSQARIGTATGGFLDLASGDFFGGQLPRRPGDTDDTFRARLKANLLVDKATRTALLSAVQTVSGAEPVVQEPLQGPGLAGYGYGGFNVPGYAFGNSAMAFQVLMTCFPNGAYTTRSSSATFVDGAGMVRTAPTYSLRTDHSVLAGGALLCEPRSFNLVKDSVGWSGFIIPQGTAWSSSPGILAPVPLDTAGTMVSAIAGIGIYEGPSIEIVVTDQVVTASIWIHVIGGTSFSSLNLRLRDETGHTTTMPIPLVATSGWQRCWVTHTRTQAGQGTILMDLYGGVLGGGCSLATQCWQIEPGPSMTSYIPTTGMVGVREADQAVSIPQNGAIAVDRFTRDDVIARTLPAGIVAWVRDIQ